LALRNREARRQLPILDRDIHSGGAMGREGEMPDLPIFLRGKALLGRKEGKDEDRLLFG
jgi:hypothetical protein